MDITRFVTFYSIQEFENKSLLNLSSEFKVIHEFSLDGYRRIWKNDLRMMIVTYCEGDIITQICESNEEYQQELNKAAKFYDEY
jgi:hypothetical protein